LTPGTPFGIGALHMPTTTNLKFIAPLLPTSAKNAPAGDDWIHELKHDGYRTVLVADGHRVRAFTRNGHDWSDVYTPLVGAAAKKLGTRTAIIDGEVIVPDTRGLSDINAIKPAISRAPQRLLFMAFDLLHLDGKDLRLVQLVERRDELRRLIGRDKKSALQFSDHVLGDGPAFFTAAEKAGAEGIISKRATSLYGSGRRTSWLKVKAFMETPMIVVGTEATKRGVEALLATEECGEFCYAGRALITMSGKERTRLWETLQLAHIASAPLSGLKRGRGAKDGHWFRPEVRVGVRYLRSEALLRHASVRSLLNPN
jgi:bifunctional non-homologous end joining protein LigD